RSRAVDDGPARRALADACARLGVRRPPRLATVEGPTCPILWAWSRPPVVLIPPEDRAGDWSAVFCHELAHLRRRDHWASLAAARPPAAVAVLVRPAVRTAVAARGAAGGAGGRRGAGPLPAAGGDGGSRSEGRSRQGPRTGDRRRPSPNGPAAVGRRCRGPFG